jgi:chorismate mutase/prephenate dehydratase
MGCLVITMALDVFTGVEKGLVTYGVVPFENSTRGSIAETLDRFMQSTLKIRSETYLHVST